MCELLREALDELFTIFGSFAALLLFFDDTAADVPISHDHLLADGRIGLLAAGVDDGTNIGKEVGVGILKFSYGFVGLFLFFESAELCLHLVVEGGEFGENLFRRA